VSSWKSVVPGGFMKKTFVFLAVVLTFNVQLLTFNCFSEVKGLVGYWSFDEGKGTIAKDSAGKSDGELQGDPEWVEGKKGKAIYFDGAEQTVIIQNSDSLSSADITVMMWIKADELRIQGLADKSSSADSWRLFMDSDVGNVEFDACADQFNASSKAKAAAGKWYHVAGTFESATKKMKIYVDGKMSGIFAKAETAGNDFDGSIQIASPENNRFHGAIDEVKIFNRALTAEEIAAETGVAVTQ